MKRRYKITLYMIIIILIINSSSPVLGNDISRNRNEERFKEICLEVKNMNIENQVQEFIKDGMNEEDADYYIRLNILVEKLEQENLEVLIDSDKEDVSDKDFFINKRYYRDRILNGDKSALKKALKSLNTLVNSLKYTDKIIDAFSSKKAIDIIYPDETKIIYKSRRAVETNSEPIEINPQRKWSYVGKKTTVDETNVENKIEYQEVNSGYEETIMEEGVISGVRKLEFIEGEWTFQCEAAFSKIYLSIESQIEEDGTAEIKYVRGGQSSYGIVNIANSTGGVVSRTKSQGEELPAEARNEVIFTVSSAFAASFLILSISIEPGLNWTQYIVFRLYSPEEIDGEYKAIYRWYAAYYK